MKFPILVLPWHHPTQGMSYGLWLQNPCKLTWKIQNYMAYEGLWLMPGMG